MEFGHEDLFVVEANPQPCPSGMQTRSKTSAEHDIEMLEMMNKECLKDIEKRKLARNEKKYELRPRRKKICYTEYEEPEFDEYLWCMYCKNFVYDYCSVHDAPLVILDTKTPVCLNANSPPRAVLTLPIPFLHLGVSTIPGAGLGVFVSLPMPKDVTFGPYQGVKCFDTPHFGYSWQVHERKGEPSYLLDASDPNKSNWMRYVNCSRYALEQNMVAYQFKGQIYYRTIKNIPSGRELLVFYGAEFAIQLGINVAFYNIIPEPLLRSDCDPDLRRALTKLFLKARGHKSLQDITKPQQSTITEEISNNSNKTITPIIDSQYETSTCSVERNEMISVLDNASNELILQNEEDCLDTKEKHDKNITVDETKLLNNQINLKHNTQLELPATELTKTISTKKEGRYECDICAKKYSTKHLLKTHVSLHSNAKMFQCEICSKCFTTKVYLALHKNIHTGIKNYKCQMCGKAFTHRNTLSDHIKIHTGTKDYKCQMCGKAFTHRNTLSDHIKIHSGTKDYKCQICSKAFTQKSHLNSHIKSHTGTKDYKCQMCGKAFTHRNTLSDHIKIHTGTKDYKCQMCGKAFTHRNTLSDHIKIHSGTKDYKCQICSKAFTQKSHLNSHIKSHTGTKDYKCQMCGKAFTHRNTLSDHIKIHTGTKDYKCQMCGKAFTHRNTLSDHIKIHTGTKDYKCQICRKAFTWRSNLNRHMKTHNNSKS